MTEAGEVCIAYFENMLREIRANCVTFIFSPLMGSQSTHLLKVMLG